ncbi:MAG: hypothetical protein ACREQO_13410 [Candidatus Binatia bacterium]
MFVNRDAEQRELDAAAKRGGLLVVFGRRRVGKTRLLRQWLQPRDGMYSQAIEAQRDLQIQQVFADLRPQLETQLVPKTWPELLEILALQKRRWVVCLDEFPKAEDDSSTNFRGRTRGLVITRAVRRAADRHPVRTKYAIRTTKYERGQSDRGGRPSLLNPPSGGDYG